MPIDWIVDYTRVSKIGQIIRKFQEGPHKGQIDWLHREGEWEGVSEKDEEGGEGEDEETQGRLGKGEDGARYLLLGPYSPSPKA